MSDSVCLQGVRLIIRKWQIIPVVLGTVPFIMSQSSIFLPKTIPGIKVDKPCCGNGSDSPWHPQANCWFYNDWNKFSCLVNHNCAIHTHTRLFVRERLAVPNLALIYKDGKIFCKQKLNKYFKVNVPSSLGKKMKKLRQVACTLRIGLGLPRFYIKKEETSFFKVNFLWEELFNMKKTLLSCWKTKLTRAVTWTNDLKIIVLMLYQLSYLALYLPVRANPPIRSSKLLGG